MNTSIVTDSSPQTTELAYFIFSFLLAAAAAAVYPYPKLDQFISTPTTLLVFITEES